MADRRVLFAGLAVPALVAVAAIVGRDDPRPPAGPLTRLVDRPSPRESRAVAAAQREADPALRATLAALAGDLRAALGPDAVRVDVDETLVLDCDQANAMPSPPYQDVLQCTRTGRVVAVADDAAFAARMRALHARLAVRYGPLSSSPTIPDVLAMRRPLRNLPDARYARGESLTRGFHDVRVDFLDHLADPPLHGDETAPVAGLGPGRYAVVVEVHVTIYSDHQVR